MSSIIPMPFHEETHSGLFIFHDSDTIKNSVDFPLAVNEINAYLKIRVADNGRIFFTKDETIQDEGYSLLISEEALEIKAKTERGAHYAITSLRQLLPEICELLGLANGMSIPCIVVEDKPEFAYRGFMMDVARHFFPKDEVMRIIRIISLYKFNYFHFHISDDQGFRLDIPKYPKLKEISSHREESEEEGVFLKNTIKMDGKPEGGYYTSTDIDEIVKYANDRFIKVIPEVDVPGHFTAVLAAYPEYLCFPRDIKVRTTWGISKDVLCIGNPDSLLFVNDLLIEVMKMFHTDEIHIGGDECPTHNYKKCPKCQTLMKKEGIKNVKELQGYFTDRLSFLLKEEGYKVRIWNEAISPSLPKDVVIQYWMAKDPKTVFDAIKRGSKVIASPFMRYYLDYIYPLFSLKDTYEFNPYYDELNGQYKENILGVETPIWTEWVKDRQRLEFQIFPRCIAVSESAWTSPKQKNYLDFLYRLNNNLQRLKMHKVNFAPYECYTQESKKITKGQTIKYFLFAKRNMMNAEYDKWNKKEEKE